MSSKSIEVRVAFIMKMVSHIDCIILRHGKITKVLEDEVEAKPAMMMALMQIGESLNKIDHTILEKFDLLEDTIGSYNVRNFIAHDYDGVDLALIETIIRVHFPILKEKMKKLESKYCNNDTNKK